MASTTCTRAIYSLLSSIRAPHLLQDLDLPCFSVSLPQAAFAVYMHPPLHLAETLLSYLENQAERANPKGPVLLPVARPGWHTLSPPDFPFVYNTLSTQRPR